MLPKENIIRNKLKEAVEYVQTTLNKKSFVYPRDCQSADERYEYLKKEVLPYETFGRFDKDSVDELIHD